MKRALLSYLLVGGLLATFLAFEGTSAAAQGNISLVSTLNTGGKGNIYSSDPSVSADGARVAFSFLDTNSDAAVGDPESGVYVKDLITGEVSLASTSDRGENANQYSADPSLSASGTKVAFSSLASNLGPADTNRSGDIYVKNMKTGGVTLASTLDYGEVDDVCNSACTTGSYEPSLSADGSRVAFLSGDPLGPDGNDVYVKDLTSGDITLVSGPEWDGQIHGLSLSGDGTRVAFATEAELDPADRNDPPNYRWDVYVRDLSTGALSLASVSAAGEKGRYISQFPSLSADGVKVAFQSYATNLDPTDTVWSADIYVKNLATGDITLASTSDEGERGSGYNGPPSLSADGTKVGFQFQGTNLDPADTDPISDIYVKDLTAGDITLASMSDAGAKGNEHSVDADLSADGGIVAFTSDASNLDLRDTTSDPDVYVKNFAGSSVSEPLQYVALGDSFSSGEGVEPFEPNVDGPTTDKHCHRSRHAYGRVFASLASIELDLFACSGAKIKDFYKRQKPLELPQLERLTSDTDLVTLTIGGNDVLFADVVLSCKTSAFCQDDWPGLDEHIDSLESDLTNLYKEIGKAIGDDGAIVVLDYPQIFASKQQERFCLTFGRSERTWLRDRTSQMTDVIRRAVVAARVGDDAVEDIKLVTVLNALKGHEICENEADRWINGLNARHPKYSYHPNRCGQEVIAETLYRRIREYFPVKGNSPFDLNHCSTI